MPLKLLLLLGLGLIQESGTPSQSRVVDRAGFFSAEARQKAEAALQSFTERMRRESLFVETFAEIPPDRRAEFEREGKDKFFAEWANTLLKARKKPAVLVLVCKKPMRLHVSVSPELVRVFPAGDASELSSRLAKLFGKQEYDAGLNDAVKYVSGAVGLRGRNLGARAAGLQAPTFSQEEQAESAKLRDRLDIREEEPASVWSYVLWIGGGLILLWLVIGVFRAVMRPALPPVGTAGGPGASYGYQPGGYGALPPPPAGGGFMGNFLGGLFGAAAGYYLYDQFFRGSPGSHAAASPSSPQEPWTEPQTGGEYGGAGADFGPAGGDYGGAGADFGPSGGDFGGAGGDFGGAGGDFGGGDFGGMD